MSGGGPALLNAERSLVSSGSVSYHSASASADVYEGYVFSLIVSTADRHGAGVSYRDVNGAKVSSLIFRTNPGHLYSDHPAYTYAVIEFAGAPALEVHLGVYVQGTSGVLHECDVLILPAEEAAISRTQRIAPRGE